LLDGELSVEQHGDLIIEQPLAGFAKPAMAVQTSFVAALQGDHAASDRGACDLRGPERRPDRL